MPPNGNQIFLNALEKLKGLSGEELIENRILKYDKMGRWIGKDE